MSKEDQLTGRHTERMVPGTEKWRRTYGEHISRYQFAADQSGSPRRIADVGCGVGYGARWLAERTGAKVDAFDASGEAIQTAEKYFPHPGVSFQKKAMEDMPDIPNTYDMIVALEVIEHLAGPERLVEWARGSLAPGGVFVVSTPNSLIQPKLADGRTPRNQYHLREFTEQEFRGLLGEYFSIVEIHSQRFTPEFQRLYDAMRGVVEDFRHQILALRLNPMIRLAFAINRLRGAAVPTLPTRDTHLVPGPGDYEYPRLEGDEERLDRVFVAVCRFAGTNMRGVE